MSTRLALAFSALITCCFFAVIGLANLLEGSKPSRQVSAQQPVKAKKVLPASAEIDLTKSQDLTEDLKALSGRADVRFVYIDTAQLNDDVLLSAKETGLLTTLIQANASDGQRPASVDEISSLDLQSCAISDRGLTALSSLANLQEVYLSKTKVTAASLPTLLALPKLKYLELDQSLLSDELLLQCQKAGKLHVLWFVVGKGQKHPESADEIDRLELGDKRVTDASVPALLTCKNLKSLVLTNSQLTDQGLASLSALEHLKYLNIGKTKVTNDAAEAFATKKPKCRVDHFE